MGYTYEVERRMFPDMRVRAARCVARNWRVRRRLPLITAFAKELGYIDPNREGDWRCGNMYPVEEVCTVYGGGDVDLLRLKDFVVEQVEDAQRQEKECDKQGLPVASTYWLGNRAAWTRMLRILNGKEKIPS
jgi:hypothetical protein